MSLIDDPPKVVTLTDDNEGKGYVMIILSFKPSVGGVTTTPPAPPRRHKRQATAGPNQMILNGFFELKKSEHANKSPAAQFDVMKIGSLEYTKPQLDEDKNIVYNFFKKKEKDLELASLELDRIKTGEEFDLKEFFQNEGRQKVLEQRAAKTTAFRLKKDDLEEFHNILKIDETSERFLAGEVLEIVTDKINFGYTYGQDMTDKIHLFQENPEKLVLSENATTFKGGLFVAIEQNVADKTKFKLTFIAPCKYDDASKSCILDSVTPSNNIDELKREWWKEKRVIYLLMKAKLSLTDEVEITDIEDILIDHPHDDIVDKILDKVTVKLNAADSGQPIRDVFEDKVHKYSYIKITDKLPVKYEDLLILSQPESSMMFSSKEGLNFACKNNDPPSKIYGAEYGHDLTDLIYLLNGEPKSLQLAVEDNELEFGGLFLIVGQKDEGAASKQSSGNAVLSLIWMSEIEPPPSPAPTQESLFKFRDCTAASPNHKTCFSIEQDPIKFKPPLFATDKNETWNVIFLVIERTKLWEDDADKVLTVPKELQIDTFPTLQEILDKLDDSKQILHQDSYKYSFIQIRKDGLADQFLKGDDDTTAGNIFCDGEQIIWQYNNVSNPFASASLGTGNAEFTYALDTSTVEEITNPQNLEKLKLITKDNTNEYNAKGSLLLMLQPKTENEMRLLWMAELVKTTPAAALTEIALDACNKEQNAADDCFDGKITAKGPEFPEDSSEITLIFVVIERKEKYEDRKLQVSADWQEQFKTVQNLFDLNSPPDTPLKEEPWKYTFVRVIKDDLAGLEIGPDSRIFGRNEGLMTRNGMLVGNKYGQTYAANEFSFNNTDGVRLDTTAINEGSILFILQRHNQIRAAGGKKLELLHMVELAKLTAAKLTAKPDACMTEDKGCFDDKVKHKPPPSDKKAEIFIILVAREHPRATHSLTFPDGFSQEADFDLNNLLSKNSGTLREKTWKYSFLEIEKEKAPDPLEDMKDELLIEGTKKFEKDGDYFKLGNETFGKVYNEDLTANAKLFDSPPEMIRVTIIIKGLLFVIDVPHTNGTSPRNDADPMRLLWMAKFAGPEHDERKLTGVPSVDYMPPKAGGMRLLTYLVFDDQAINDINGIDRENFILRNFLASRNITDNAKKYTVVITVGQVNPETTPGTVTTTTTSQGPVHPPGSQPGPIPGQEIECNECYTLSDKKLFTVYKKLGTDCTQKRKCPLGSRTCMNFNVKDVDGQVRVCSKAVPQKQSDLGKCVSKKVPSDEGKFHCVSVKFADPKDTSQDTCKNQFGNDCGKRRCYQCSNILSYKAAFGVDCHQIVKCSSDNDFCVYRLYNSGQYVKGCGSSQDFAQAQGLKSFEHQGGIKQLACKTDGCNKDLEDSESKADSVMLFARHHMNIMTYIFLMAAAAIHNLHHVLV